MGLLSSQLPTKALVPLCRQLATSYDAGIPIMQGLDLVARDTRSPRTATMLRQMRDDIKSGATLAEAAKAQERYLPPIFLQLLSAGEYGGRLDRMLSDLADYYEDRLAMRRQIWASLAYPLILLIAGWYLGTFAFRIVNAALAGLTSRTGEMFDFTSFFRGYGWFQLKAHIVFLLIAAAGVVLSRMGLLRWIRCALTTFVWPLAPVTRRFALARFFRSMSLLIGAGVPITHCIERSAAVTVNPYIERGLLSAVPVVKSGGTLTQAFAGAGLTPTAREMLHVGEESGQLEQQLRKVSEYHMAEAVHAVDIATRVLRVAVVAVVGSVIGYVVITFYMRLYGGMLDGLGI